VLKHVKEEREGKLDTLLHTPDGVRDIYGRECAVKNKIENAVMKEMQLFGYDRIETPTFEFFDIFNQERGSVSSREMYKFFDRDNNTLVLRPDMTPSIARCVAKFFTEEDMPLRLCCLGNIYINNTNYKGRLKESTQAGAELIGDDSAAADAEMIILVIRSLLAAGLKEFQVELGEADFYRGITDKAGLSPEQDRELRELIENKNSFGVEEFADSHIRDDNLKKTLLKMPELFGSVENIREAGRLSDNPGSSKAIERLLKVHSIIEEYGLTDYVSYDLGMLSQYEYYTGIIFKAYTYGTGDYIVNGGRYDRLLSQFGKNLPAVGFGIAIDRLMSAMMGQHIDVSVRGTDTLVVYSADHSKEAADTAMKLRNEGKRTAVQLRKQGKSDADYRAYAERSRIEKVIFI